MIGKDRAVFIDADDTLLDFKACAKRSLDEACEAFSLTLPDNALSVFFKINDELWRSLERGELSFEKLHEIRWVKIFDALGVDFDGPTFESVFWKRLREIAVKMEGAEELLSYLSKKYVVCIASNAPVGQQDRKLTEIGLIKYVDHIFVSGDIGVAKPKREFFDGCFASLPEIVAGQTYMIGDSLTADVRGAHDYGMKTIWFNHRREDESQSCADKIVYKLVDIIDIL
ncbi:MAG: HAD-IA family hydrolase [Clostridia bacterium]|nr:HAD-IA family hydrolase [Clostridia bacterium]